MTSSSPQPSFLASESETLERLVSHFVAAKRSLSATAHVYRANEIVDTARSLIEEAAVLEAKNAFLERGVNEEANVLVAVKDGLDGIGRDANNALGAIALALDSAYTRIETTIQRLQETVVDHSFDSAQPTSKLDDSGSSQPSAPYTQRTLHDFISESGHTTLLDSLRQDMDLYEAAQKTYYKSQAEFDQSLTTLGKALRRAEDASSRTVRRQQSSITQGQEDAGNSQIIPDTFHSLTAHATESASLLQSLIGHYDLCSTALKHTEGGGEAARAAAAESAADPAMEATDQSLYDGAKAREPITLEERTEMTTVIENDAQEVDDVVFEIGERISDMESHLSQISNHTVSARTCHTYLAKVLQLLHNIGHRLPAYIAAANTFNLTWSQLEEEMKHKMSELGAVTGIYEGFLASYALLLKEASRRATVEAKMKKILDKARREVDVMADHELESRRRFYGDISEFMPRDLWPGLEEAPTRWDFVALAQESLNKPDQSGQDRY